MNTTIAKNIAGYRRWQSAVESVADQLSEGVGVCFSYAGFNAYKATRDDLRVLMSLLPGRVWDKCDAQDGDMRYTFHDIVDGDFVSLSVDCSELPPTCRVEWIEEEVPAQPATVRKRAKIVCNE